MKRLAAYLRYLRDERGVETLEWIVVGGAIAATAIIVYGTNMSTRLTSALNNILNSIPGAGS